MSLPKLYVAGHSGLLGSAIYNYFQKTGQYRLVVRSHAELDLTKAEAVNQFFSLENPDIVIMAAGRVGGIVANQKAPADFITENLAIQLNVIQNAHKAGCKRVIFFASSCMYPRDCSQPMDESLLFSGKPEPTSMAYAVSKMAGLQMCLAYNCQYDDQTFLPVIPNSVYGPQDNFGLESSHVLSALMRRFDDAKRSGADHVQLWGSGTPLREFVYSRDVARACALLLKEDIKSLSLPVNLGSGDEVSIRDLATKIAAVVGFKGKIFWDTSKSDGAPRKRLDSTCLRSMGWAPKVTLDEGLKRTYDWYSKQIS